MAVGDSALVEREPELEAMEWLIGRARARAGAAVVIEGPPGIGKSSLLAAARERAADLRVLSARGGELEREFPFGIVRQLLEPVVVGADDLTRRALQHDRHPAILRECSPLTKSAGRDLPAVQGRRGNDAGRTTALRDR